MDILVTELWGWTKHEYMQRLFNLKCGCRGKTGNVEGRFYS